MKRALIIATAVLLAVGFSGCEGKSSEKEIKTSLQYESLEKYDVRSLMWGMSIEQVAAQECDCTVVQSENGGYVARNVDFAHHTWTIIYELSSEGLSELCYMYYGNEDPDTVFSDAEISLTAQNGVGQIDENESRAVTLWRTDSCDIELYKSSDGMVCINFAPCGTYEYKFSLYDGESEPSVTEKQFSLTVPHGEVLDVHETGDTLIIKTKITPKADNHKTISQNFQNLEDLIINQGCSKYSEIQYWAVADMTDGSESKVVSFTAPESTIKGIKDGSIDVIAYLDEYGYLEDVYILPSLKD